MQLDVSNVKQDRLCIPAKFTLDHFPPIPKRSPRCYKERVKILSGTQDRVWPMTIRYDPDDSVFLLNSEWKEFAALHEMKAKDTICFYSLLPLSQDIQFLIDHVKRNPKDDYIVSCRNCRKELFLFEHQLTYFDFNFRLLTKEVVRKHFQAVRIPAETHKIERLYFMDMKNMDWRVQITMSYNHYIIGRGWDQCAKYYMMESGDSISFYRPILPYIKWHFLICILKPNLKPKEAGTSKPTEKGGPSERKDDKGGNGKGGYKPPQGGGVGRGDGGGGKSAGGSSNEKKSLGVGHCCIIEWHESGSVGG